jgi:hypothetical protein
MPEVSDYGSVAPWRGEWVGCPKCQRHMLLTRTKEPMPGRVLHLFACADCGIAQVMSLDKNSDIPAPMKWVLNGVKAVL